MFRLFLNIILFLICTPFLKAIDLDAPETVKLTFDIRTNLLHIYWNPSTSPDLNRYEVWYPNYSSSLGRISYTPVSGTAVDPSVRDVEFIIPEALKNSMGFYVRAFDNSGNESPVIPIPCDSTVFLVSRFDSCSSSAFLKWNDYNVWREKTNGYRIYGSTDGVNYQFYNSISADTSVTINNLIANRLYRFYVLITNKNSGDSVFSNRVDVNTNMSVNPDFIHADFGTVVNEHPLVRFSVDPASQLVDYVLLRAESPNARFDSIALVHSTENIIEYTDESVSSAIMPYYYKLNSLNYCKQITRSSDNIAGTILLKANVNGKKVNLDWNNYYNWIGGVENYKIERKLNSQNYETVTSTTGLSYTDNSFENQGDQMVGSEICYKITALENQPVAAASTSTSNEVCVSLEMNVRFEYNAFVPNSSDNNSFGPTMDFIPESVNFRIFNRWGNLVFESSDPANLSWNGFFKGELAEQGVYRYHLEFKSETGKTVSIDGNVTVIYP